MSAPGDDLSFYTDRSGGPSPASQRQPMPYAVPSQQAMYGQQAAALAILGKKSAGLAAVLSILLVGAGQMYCGRVGRGLAFLGAYVLSAVLAVVLIGLLLLPVVFIWALVDAVALANRHNAELAHRLSLGGFR
ncbi:MAG: hypothetical protein ACOYXW_09185 [Actinomycetota bacterium]